MSDNFEQEREYYTQNATEKIFVRIVPSLKRDLKSICATSNIKMSELITSLLWQVAVSTEEYFYCCKTCNEPIVYKEANIPVFEMTFTCSKGHKNSFAPTENE